MRLYVTLYATLVAAAAAALGGPGLVFAISVAAGAYLVHQVVQDDTSVLDAAATWIGLLAVDWAALSLWCDVAYAVPSLLPAVPGLAWLYWRLGRTQRECRKAERQIAKRDAAHWRRSAVESGTAAAHLNLGHALLRTGDLAGAAGAYRRAIARDPATAMDVLCFLARRPPAEAHAVQERLPDLSHVVHETWQRGPRANVVVWSDPRGRVAPGAVCVPAPATAACFAAPPEAGCGEEMPTR